MLSDGLYVRVSRRGDETRGLDHGGRRAAERHHLADVLQATVVSVRRKCFRRRRTEAGGKSGGFATLHVAGDAELVRFRVDFEGGAHGIPDLQGVGRERGRRAGGVSQTGRTR